MAVQPINASRRPAAGHGAVAAETAAGLPIPFSAVRDSRGQTRYLWMNTPLEELSSVKLSQLLHEYPAAPAPVGAAITGELRLRGEEDLLQRWQPPH